MKIKNFDWYYNDENSVTAKYLVSRNKGETVYPFDVSGDNIVDISISDYQNFKIDPSATIVDSWVFYNIARIDPSATDASAVELMVDITGYSGEVGKYNSLIIDVSGIPYISYYNDTYHYLKYITKVNTEWVDEVVDSSGNVGKYSSIDLDSMGNPHIAYFDETNGCLKYAYKNFGNWNISVVDSSGVGQYSSLKMDRGGNPNIAYYDYLNGALKYAKWIGNNWKIETIDPTYPLGGYGTQCSLSMDSLNYPHIGYNKFSTNTIEYAKWNGNLWDVSAIDTKPSGFSNISLKLDSLDYPHVSYSSNGMYHAQVVGNSWNIQTLSTDVSAGLYLSSCINSNNESIICYSLGSDLWIARRNSTTNTFVPYRIMSGVGNTPFNSIQTSRSMMYLSFHGNSLQYTEFVEGSPITIKTLDPIVMSQLITFFDKHQYTEMRTTMLDYLPELVFGKDTTDNNYMILEYFAKTYNTVNKDISLMNFYNLKRLPNSILMPFLNTMLQLEFNLDFDIRIYREFLVNILSLLLFSATDQLITNIAYPLTGYPIYYQRVKDLESFIINVHYLTPTDPPIYSRQDLGYKLILSVFNPKHYYINYTLLNIILRKFILAINTYVLKDLIIYPEEF